MSVRLVLVDHVVPMETDKGDVCTGCPRLNRDQGTCRHFGKLGKRPDRKKTYLRHPHCIRAEERTRHASYSVIMLQGDFDETVTG